MSKRQRNENARKVEYEQVTPSMDVPEAMTSSPIDVTEIGEPSQRGGDDIE